jgi:hypothetical protein
VPEEINPATAENLVTGAMRFLPVTPGKKVFCTKRQLQDCLLRLAQEAYAIGFLAGQKEQFGGTVPAGAPERPEWMDIALESENLAKYGLRLRPVV